MNLTQLRSVARVPVLLLMFATLFSGVDAAAADRPNIFFILVDDQSPFDLKVYDPKSQLDSPNIDRLAAQGLIFGGSYQMGSWSHRRAT